MSTRALFLLQFFWFLLAWAAVARLVIAPRLRHLDVETRLSIWIAPLAFRVLGVGLLVANLSPDMPRSFALPTAIGDSATAVLAVLALLALHRRSSSALALAWICNVVGSLDLLVALPHAASIDAAQYLRGQWYVPALVLPLMIVAHVAVFKTLLEARAKR